MIEPVVRDDFSRGEAVGGLVWLSVGAALSALLEVVYLQATIFGVPFPLSVVIAALFNAVLTRTARLWSPNPAVALVPFFVWMGTLFLLMFAVPGTGASLVPHSLLTMLLLLAGSAGAVWPLVRPK
ncbi:hypothetical protein [Corynebacterium timonense]|uniref:Uncharacterized protein n=1 Tax=Corynebacterium timonense TaxID=441500 RepID=A0A1H1QG52_9CORY|nr:hypothetical protein [Corynebacterium timonense]SDS22531.1 hypothetical protein SAMN04488539_1256 [Corynebacterium timonense]